MVNGLPVLNNVHVDCEAFSPGKMQKYEFLINVDRKKRDILELVHIDLCGPMQTRSLGGAYYFLVFVDDCMRFSWVYFLRKNSHTFEYFKEFKSMIEKKTRKTIKILHSDQPGE